MGRNIFQIALKHHVLISDKSQCGKIISDLFLPHSEAQSISELNRFLYFLISGVSDDCSVVWEGVTFTLICEPRRDWAEIDWPIKKDQTNLA